MASTSSSTTTTWLITPALRNREFTESLSRLIGERLEMEIRRLLPLNVVQSISIAWVSLFVFIPQLPSNHSFSCTLFFGTPSISFNGYLGQRRRVTPDSLLLNLLISQLNLENHGSICYSPLSPRDSPIWDSLAKLLFHISCHRCYSNVFAPELKHWNPEIFTFSNFSWKLCRMLWNVEVWSLGPMSAGIQHEFRLLFYL